MLHHGRGADGAGTGRVYHRPVSARFPPSDVLGTTPLAGDASARRYRRLALATGGSVVECRYPPDAGAQLVRDLEVRAWFASIGVAVPAVLDVDVDGGRVWLEDLGDVDAASRITEAPAAVRGTVAARLLRPLVRLAAVPPGALPPWNQPLDARLLRSELTAFERHYLAERHERPSSDGVGRWLDRLADAVGCHPVVPCHRDYHLNNLWLEADDIVRVIDEQDARLGPDSYDAVSLLFERDAGTALRDADREAVLAAWAHATGARPGWRVRVAEVRLQRGLKVLGTFARLAGEGRSGYEPWIAPLERALAGALRRAGAPLELVETLLH